MSNLLNGAGRFRWRVWLGLAMLVLALGCSATDAETSADIVPADTQTLNSEDAKFPDEVGQPDDVGLAEDISPTGSNPFGVVTEVCSTLADTALADSPNFVVNEFQFTGEAFDASKLSADSSALFGAANAGGSSKCSEVFSLELWHTCAGAVLHQGETEIVYTEAGAMTDYTVKIDEQVIGVSVTRAYLGPTNMNYSSEAAESLLTKKLNAINESSANVAPESAWTKQVLHIWTLHKDWSDVVYASWSQLDKALVANTTVVVTVESGSDFVVTDSCDD